MRFWSPQQKYLLKVLNVTGCMRKSQVLPLLRRQFDISPNAIAPICRQLRDAGYLREFDGIISMIRITRYWCMSRRNRICLHCRAKKKI